MNRRRFLSNSVILTIGGNIHKTLGMVGKKPSLIRLTSTGSNFEREKLRIPFGFKGGYLTELWQTAVQLKTDRMSGVGLATQSVLYGDANLFAANSEAAANALMFALTEKALHLAKGIPFSTPVDLFEKLLPVVTQEAVSLTGKKDINPNFVLNALVSLDNAAWLIYAAENSCVGYEQMIPEIYRPALSTHNRKIGVMFQVSYNMPIQDIEKAADEGYFIIKIKTGQPGTQREMMEKDAARIKLIHEALRQKNTLHTQHNRILYTLDCNGRYEKKATLRELIEKIKGYGLLDSLLLIEEPFPETNNEFVGDLGVRIAADESANNEENTLKRIQQGYKAIVLKAVAKTLSLTLKIAKVAQAHQIPCFCSDLTVNPILVDWHKNLAARLQPFPELGIGMMETNGKENYLRWEAMKGYLPAKDAIWVEAKQGVFELDDSFYQSAGGIFRPSDHYAEMFSKK
ncbi:enolase C-terminal domain-like protein [Chitinophaga defluvii]|uniref:Enolase C-terminal domain-like protein n=1 Tax=Chitinophaga defluvii TaxID=3163343 RepID=A0ABV2TBA5_9BACT